MSDRLKLSDPKGDAEVERVATALEQREDNSRIRQLEQNIAALERELARKKADAGGSAAQGGNNKIGARKHASFKAISTAPSINKTPIGPTMVPIPYPVVQDLSSSVNTARTVKFNGCPVYLLDGSTQPHCTGDEPGTGKGIKSGTVSGEVKPVKGCSTVRVEGKQIVREGDACTMNGGNNPGVYVTTCTPSSAPPKNASKTSNPPSNKSFKEGLSAIESWAVRVAQEMDDALKNPLRGTLGAAKELLINQPMDVVELLGRASMYEQADKLGQTAVMLGAFGQAKTAQVAIDAAQQTKGSAADLHVLKATLHGSAEKGGADIGNTVLISKAIAGLLKGGLKWAGSIRGKSGAADGAGKIADVAGNSGVRAAGNGAAPTSASAGDGVKILSGQEIADRQQLARSFYSDLGWPAARIDSHVAGIDFNEPVVVETLLPGTVVGQWQMPGGKVGNYFAPLGTEASQLGINPAGRVLGTYSPSEPVKVLRSTAAPIIDTWTVPGKPYSAQGGGTQFFTGKPSIFIPTKP